MTILFAVQMVALALGALLETRKQTTWTKAVSFLIPITKAYGCGEQGMVFPTGQMILMPYSGDYVCARAQLTCMGTNGQDLDWINKRWVQDNCVLHWWGDGYFPYGCMGEYVTWWAPSSAGDYTIYAAGDDTFYPDTAEYDWPWREYYKVSVSPIHVLVPQVARYNFSGDVVPVDASKPVYEKGRYVNGHLFESEFTAARRNANLGLKDAVFFFSHALTYSSSVKILAGGSFSYDPGYTTFSGIESPACALTGASNDIGGVGITLVTVLDFRYQVQYGSNVYSGETGIPGGGYHWNAVLWNPSSCAKRKNAFMAALWARGASSEVEVYDNMTVNKYGITYQPDGPAQGDGILLESPGDYAFLPSNPSMCLHLAPFLNMLASDYHGISGGSIRSWWGGTEG